MVLTQQQFKYQYLIGVTILIPTGRFFDAIIEVEYLYHTFTYRLDQHYFKPMLGPILSSIDIIRVPIMSTISKI